MANRISVVIDVIADNANRSLKNFKTSVAEADGAFGKLKAGGKSAMDGLKANAAIVGPAIGAALLGGAKVAIDAASDLEESMNAVNVTFGNAADGIHKLGENSVEFFGLSRSAFNGAAVQFSAFAKAVAGPGGDVAAVMQDLMTRAVDFASVMNIDVADAMALFQSSLAGETEPIRKYGKDLSAAAVEQYALAEGLIATKSEMTEAIKTQARYGLLTVRETSDSAGDFANTSGSLANQQKILAANMEDLAAQIGTHLVPAVAEATGGMNDLLDVADQLGLIDLAFKVQAVTSPTKALGRAMDVASGETDLFGRKILVLTDAQYAFAKSAKDAKWSADQIGDALAAGATGGVAQWAESQRWAGQAAAYAAGELVVLTDDTEELSDATGALDANVKALTESFQDQLDASKELRDERRELAGLTLDAAEAEVAFHDAVAELVEINEDATATEGEKTVKLLQTVAATDAMVSSQLLSKGVILNSERGNREWTRSMADAAVFMGGPLGSEIIAHIGRVNGIPDEKITEIQALLDAGDVAAARRLLDSELSRAEAQVSVTPVGLEAARARISQILGRNINIGVNTYVPTRSGGRNDFAKGTGGASGGLSVVGEQGPELVNLSRGDKVTEAGATRKIMQSGSSRPTIVNNYFPPGTRPDDVARASRRYEAIQGPL